MYINWLLNKKKTLPLQAETVKVRFHDKSLDYESVKGEVR